MINVLTLVLLIGLTLGVIGYWCYDEKRRDSNE